MYFHDKFVGPKLDKTSFSRVDTSIEQKFHENSGFMVANATKLSSKITRFWIEYETNLFSKSLWLTIKNWTLGRSSACLQDLTQNYMESSTVLAYAKMTWISSQKGDDLFLWFSSESMRNSLSR